MINFINSLLNSSILSDIDEANDCKSGGDDNFFYPTYPTSFNHSNTCDASVPIVLPALIEPSCEVDLLSDNFFDMLSTSVPTPLPKNDFQGTVSPSSVSSISGCENTQVSTVLPTTTIRSSILHSILIPSSPSTKKNPVEKTTVSNSEEINEISSFISHLSQAQQDHFIDRLADALGARLVDHFGYLGREAVQEMQSEIANNNHKKSNSNSEDGNDTDNESRQNSIVGQKSSSNSSVPTPIVTVQIDDTDLDGEPLVSSQTFCCGDDCSYCVSCNLVSTSSNLNEKNRSGRVSPLSFALSTTSCSVEQSCQSPTCSFCSHHLVTSLPTVVPYPISPNNSNRPGNKLSSQSSSNSLFNKSSSNLTINTNEISELLESTQISCVVKINAEIEGEEADGYLDYDSGVHSYPYPIATENVVTSTSSSSKHENEKKLNKKSSSNAVADTKESNEKSTKKQSSIASSLWAFALFSRLKDTFQPNFVSQKTNNGNSNSNSSDVSSKNKVLINVDDVRS